VLVSSDYVPNGRSLDHDHYQYKLGWMAQLRRHVDSLTAPDDAVVITGDFNIAPDDRDVFDPAKLVGSTHVSQAERDLLTDLCDWGMVDLFRLRYEQPRLYSWWDYRAGDFHQGRGMRIDLVLGTRSVADRLQWSVVDRNARKGQSPSDHAPVLVDLVDAVS
jgi:exodeoxyribonuclease-3